MDKKYYTARMLRKNATIHEKRLWNLLKNRQFHNLRFKRQVPIGNYIVDFLCPEIKLVIEIDGDSIMSRKILNMITSEQNFYKIMVSKL